MSHTHIVIVIIRIYLKTVYKKRTRTYSVLCRDPPQHYWDANPRGGGTVIIPAEINSKRHTACAPPPKLLSNIFVHIRGEEYPKRHPRSGDPWEHPPPPVQGVPLGAPPQFTGYPWGCPHPDLDPDLDLGGPLDLDLPPPPPL